MNRSGHSAIPGRTSVVASGGEPTIKFIWTPTRSRVHERKEPNKPFLFRAY